ncbi:ABC transporter permease [Rhodococcus sp. IEGM 1307]|jgi:ribose transport system permease protein|uniref:ABC transporter permease n=1 Tax=Rhodococcus sp. IEGM 1307 TaxID=3047091 RepID=UPI0010626646|nr:ABC transporter permease [Rhodococcus sp. IEGM 1307]MDI9980100.1 ABC transporter permease [Rhodococcus sp. IEGM 1307]
MTEKVEDMTAPPQSKHEGVPKSAAVQNNQEELRSTRPTVGSVIDRFGLVLAWLLVIVFFSILPATSAIFPTTTNFSTIFGSQAMIAVLTLGLIIPLSTGDFDLSIASTMTLSAMLVAVLNVNHGLPIGAAILVALATGLLIGVVNGSLILFFGIDAFIVTLGSGTFIAGVVLWISNSDTVTGIDHLLSDWVIITTFLGIPVNFWYAVALCVVLWYIFEFTPLGRRMLVVGRGRAVARLSGINVGRIRWGSFVASGLISAFAGILYAGLSGAADPTSGTQQMLPAFAAAYLGATAIIPGRFNPWGSLIAVYFLVTGITGLQLLGMQSYVQSLFYGGALVAAVVLSQLARRREATSD